MTLEKAIKHCEEVAKDKELSYKFCFHAGKSCDGQQPDREDLVNCKNNGCLKCAAEHRQLAEWLRELKAIQDIIKQHDRDSMPEDYWYIDKIRTVVLE